MIKLILQIFLDTNLYYNNNNNNNNNNLIIYKLLHDAHLVRRHRVSQEKIQGSPTSSFSISMNCNISNIPCYKPIVMHFYLDMTSYTDHVGSDSLSYSLFYYYIIKLSNTLKDVGNTKKNIILL